MTIWRHAEAGNAANDASRPITSRGRASLQLSAASFVRWLEAASVAPVSSLLYSPYLRTRETAEVLCALCLPAFAAAEHRLAPGARVGDVAELVYPERGHVVLVSHQPLVSALIALWCDDSTLASLAPGGSATVSLLSPERGGAELLQHRPDPIQSDS